MAQPGEVELLIKVMASGICGTDIHIFRGEYMGGYPVIPGHEFSGVIEQVGEGVTRFQVGERVVVEAHRTFALETDGEIVFARRAAFHVMPKRIRCCQ